MIARILVGTPSSSHAGAALEAAAELASTYDAELIVLQVAPSIDARRVFDPDGVPEVPDHLLLVRGAVRHGRRSADPGAMAHEPPGSSSVGRPPPVPRTEGSPST